MNILVRIFRFFFPKNFGAEFQKGMMIGKEGIGKKVGGGLFDAGKALRKKVDPNHKIKIGNNKK